MELVNNTQWKEEKLKLNFNDKHFISCGLNKNVLIPGITIYNDENPSNEQFNLENNDVKDIISFNDSKVFEFCEKIEKNYA